MVIEQIIKEWINKPKHTEKEIVDNRKAIIDLNNNIIIQSANPGMIKNNKNNDYTIIPIFI